MKKILIAVFFLFLLLYGCELSEFEQFKAHRTTAKQICDNRAGELIFFGKVMSAKTQEWHFESVCFKSDEQHFYYDLIE